MKTEILVVALLAIIMFTACKHSSKSQMMSEKTVSNASSQNDPFLEIAALVKNQTMPSTVQDFVQKLPPKFKDRYILIYRSQSSHWAHPLFPRIVFFNDDASVLVAISGQWDRSMALELNENEEFKKLSKGNRDLPVDVPDNLVNVEVISVNDNVSNSKESFYRFDRIVLSNPPTFSREGAYDNAFFEKECSHCHQSESPKWEPYPLWPGVYGSAIDRIPVDWSIATVDKSTKPAKFKPISPIFERQEGLWFELFLKKVVPNHPVYSQLRGLKRLDVENLATERQINGAQRSDRKTHIYSHFHYTEKDPTNLYEFSYPDGIGGTKSSGLKFANPLLKLTFELHRRNAQRIAMALLEREDRNFIVPAVLGIQDSYCDEKAQSYIAEKFPARRLPDGSRLTLQSSWFLKYSHPLVEKLTQNVFNVALPLYEAQKSPAEPTLETLKKEANGDNAVFMESVGERLGVQNLGLRSNEFNDWEYNLMEFFKLIDFDLSQFALGPQNPSFNDGTRRFVHLVDALVERAKVSNPTKVREEVCKFIPAQ